MPPSGQPVPGGPAGGDQPPSDPPTQTTRGRLAAESIDRTAAGLGLAGYAAPSPNVGPASCVTDSAGAAGTALETVLQRYAAVHLRTKPSKVQDYNAVQDLVGHTLDHNVLRVSCSRYATIRAEVLRLLRSRWCRPRDIERIVGKLTHIMLLHRQSLALFNAVYAFCRTNWPERPRRLWLSVQQELSDAIALLPLIRSDLSRPVATALLQPMLAIREPRLCTQTKSITKRCDRSAPARAELCKSRASRSRLGRQLQA